MMAYGICDNLTDMWAWTNPVDTATLSGPSASGLGVERLRDPRLGKAWRTPTGGGTVTIKFANPVPLQMFGVFGMHPYNPTMTLALSTTLGGSDVRSGAWTPAVNPLTKQCFWLNAVERGAATPAPNIMEIRLGITEAGVDIGRIWASDTQWTPSTSHSPGSQQGTVDLSAIQRTRRGGAVLADIGIVQRTHQVEYNMISDAEWDTEVFELSLLAGTHQQVLFVPNYTVYAPVRHAMLGYSESISPIVSVAFDRWSKTFNLRESG